MPRKTRSDMRNPNYSASAQADTTRAGWAANLGAQLHAAWNARHGAPAAPAAASA